MISYVTVDNGDKLLWGINNTIPTDTYYTFLYNLNLKQLNEPRIYIFNISVLIPIEYLYPIFK